MDQASSAIRVVADDREAGAGVVAALRALPDVDLEIARLPLGDYAVDDSLLAERKTFPDLVQSIEDGRLFRQAIRLAAAPCRAVLILEGRASDLAGCRMRREAIQGALISVSLLLGVPLLRAQSPAETAQLLVYAARQMRWASRRGLDRGVRRPRGKRRVQLYILQGLPGVGPGRAARLLERFGTVEAVVTATAAALREVPGVGKATAARMRWAVEEAPGAYRSAAAAH